jgi:hypothetical protein
MKRLKKTPRELEGLIMEELRATPGCEEISSIVVRSTGDRWEARPINRLGAGTTTADCWVKLRPLAGTIALARGRLWACRSPLIPLPSNLSN